MDTYDFESKHIYRKRRESAIDRSLHIPKALRRVAYLDTKEALDTISYLKRGYEAHNLYAINNNPAELAHLSIKLKSMGLPKVNTVGLDFEDALDRRIPSVDVIDFDGMGNISNKLAYMLGNITQSRPKAVYGITIMAGRESIGGSGIFAVVLKVSPYMAASNKTSFGTTVNKNHVVRLWLVLNGMANAKPVLCRPNSVKKLAPEEKAIRLKMTDQELDEEYDIMMKDIPVSQCRVHITKMYWDVYMSISKQPMLWTIFSCEPHKKLTKKQYMKIFLATNKFHAPICGYAS